MSQRAVAIVLVLSSLVLALASVRRFHQDARLTVKERSRRNRAIREDCPPWTF